MTDNRIVFFHSEGFTDGGIEYVTVTTITHDPIEYEIMRSIAEEIYPNGVYVQKRDRNLTPGEYY